MTNLREHFGGFGNRLFQLAYIYAQARKGDVPDIYIQDEKYFKEYGDELRQIFAMGIPKIDMVSVHVRRGDYVNNPFYVDLFGSGYYEKAMAQFPGEQFLIFSDDIPWCKEQEIFKSCSFSEGNNEVVDFNFMAGCYAHIIANSSFSWWAAYTGGGKVIAPKDWYADGVVRTSIPDSWIKI